MGASKSNSASFRVLPIKNRAVFPALEPEKSDRKTPTFRERSYMITGLTKKQKTTSIFFDEHSSTVEILTHNTDLKKRLTKYAAEHPDLCRQTDDDGQGGLAFEIEKGRFSFRLTSPYSEERRQQASNNAKGKGIQIRKERTNHEKAHL
jgi:hypothetical protein